MHPQEDKSEKGRRQEGKTEEHSFDELAKGLASRTISRRQVFKWFGGAVLGGVLASIPGVAWAKECSGGQIKEKGECVCPSGTTFCSGSCVPSNCDANQFFNEATCTCEPSTCSQVTFCCSCQDNGVSVECPTQFTNVQDCFDYCDKVTKGKGEGAVFLSAPNQFEPNSQAVCVLGPIVEGGGCRYTPC